MSLGCGLGYDVLALRSLGIDAYGLEMANMAPTWEAIHGDEAYPMVVSTDGGIPFPDASFDLIVSVNVLEHVGTIPPKEIVTKETAAERRRFISRAIGKLN